MADLLKGLAGKSAFLIAWTFAAAIAVGASALFLLPTALNLGLAQFLNGWSEPTKGLVLVALVMAVGFTMGATSTPLYRLLEGYSWPRGLRDWASRRQQRRKWCLRTELDHLPQQKLIERALVWERLSRYPPDDDQVTPTSLGNAIRAFETYGLDRFGLDSQSFWNELQALAPKNLQDELDNSRAATDFFVGMVYLTAFYGLAALALAGDKLHGNQGYDIPLIAQGAAVLVLGPALTYRLAISSTTYWASTVQAMVNIGRVPLAQTMGLRMPATLEAERQMWTALSRLVFYPFDQDQIDEIDQFRAPPGSQTASSSGWTCWA